MKHLVLAAIALAAHGCALDAGEGFARLEPGELRVALEIAPARAVSEHGVLTDLGYRVELDSCSVAIDRIELQTLVGAAEGGARFDPANPPAGYTLCHGGHCHAEDGSLDSYEEIQAQLAGSAARWEPLATVKLDRTFDLLRDESRALRDYAPMPELPRAVIGRAAVFWDAFRCTARVERDALPEPLELEVELPLSAEPLSAVVDQTVSRDGPETLRPALRVRVDGTLFDGLPFAELSTDGVRIDGSTDASVIATEGLIEATTLTVEWNRGRD